MVATVAWNKSIAHYPLSTIHYCTFGRENNHTIHTNWPLLKSLLSLSLCALISFSPNGA